MHAYMYMYVRIFVFNCVLFALFQCACLCPMRVDHDVSTASLEQTMTSLREQLTQEVLDRFRRFLGLMQRLPFSSSLAEDVQAVSAPSPAVVIRTRFVSQSLLV